MKLRPVLCALLLAAIAALALAGPAAAAQPGFVETTGQTVNGPAAARDTHAKWVRLWLAWTVAQPSRSAYDQAQFRALNAKIAAYHAVGTKVIVVLYTTPQWARVGLSANLFTPPARAADYGAFARYAAGAVPGADAWEIWNEEDDNGFWEHGPQVAAYTRLLRAAYPAIKSVQPSDTVVVGGMVGQDVAFLNGIYANGGKGYFDAVGAHTDFACLVEDPSQYYRDPNGWLGRYTFSGYRELHYVMSRHGDGAKPIWLTEIGWNTSTTQPGSCARGQHAHMKPAGVSEAFQAAMVTRAYECLAADNYVQVALWFSLQDADNGPEDDHRLGLIRHDGTHKPAYDAFARLHNGVKAANCGGVADHTPPQLTLSAPFNGARYQQRFPLRASASDSATRLVHIEALVDGVRRHVWHATTIHAPSWWIAAKIPYGRHTLTLRAMDAAGNVTSRSVIVTRVRHLPALASRATVRVGRPAADGSVRVSVAIRHPGALESPVGRATVIFEQRHGKHWKAAVRRTVGASSSQRLTVQLGHGQWRVYAVYTKHAPYRASQSAYRLLTVR
jgi:hypothetical protein